MQGAKGSPAVPAREFGFLGARSLLFQDSLPPDRIRSPVGAQNFSKRTNCELNAGDRRAHGPDWLRSTDRAPITVMTEGDISPTYRTARRPIKRTVPLIY
jgi:hypothetical protein